MGLPHPLCKGPRPSLDLILNFLAFLLRLNAAPFHLMPTHVIVANYQPKLVGPRRLSNVAVGMGVHNPFCSSPSW